MNENGNVTSKVMECIKISSKREVNFNRHLPIGRWKDLKLVA
jgi:hypothetical protein